MRLKTQKGLSLVETMMALGLGSIFLATVLSTWYYSSQSWKQENTLFDERLMIAKAMERIKADVRLSDAAGIVYYPASASTYTAISLSAATPSSSTGLLTFDAGTGKIQWDKTVMYHTYVVDGRTELRRTVLDSFDSSSANRQTILDTTVADGTYDDADTITLFSATDVDIEIVPQNATFDAYAASTSRSPSTTFGSFKVASGTHEVRFQVTGKNAASGGYQMGIDSLFLSPSGGVQEAEALTIPNSSGGSASTQDMTSYSGSWGGGEQIKFSSSAANHYVTFETSYDQWLESNFASVTHSTTSTTTGADPHVTVATRETQTLAPSWTAVSQSGGAVAVSNGEVLGKTVRVVLSGADITKSGVMARLKFLVGDPPVQIRDVYFGTRSGTTPNFNLYKLVYFDNIQVAEGGDDGAGSTADPGTATQFSITKSGYHVWSNWFEWPGGINPGTDYLVSYYVISGNVSSWDAGAGTQSYTVDNGNYSDPTGGADNNNWTAAPTGAPDVGYSVSSNIYAVMEVAAFANIGVATSQVYDTKLMNPSYSQLSWSPVLPAGSTIAMQIRTASSADMSGATAWSALPSYTASPVSLGGLASQRYVQFRATLTAASPYSSLPELDDVKITWPGQTSVVDFGGYYTLGPSNGVFKVLVDGQSLIKALELKLTASENYRGKTYSFSLNTEQESLNTGL